MIFGVLNPGKIWRQQLVQLPTSPIHCSRFTLRNSKSHFTTVIYIHTSYYLRYLRRKQTVTPLATNLKNVSFIDTVPPYVMPIYFPRISFWWLQGPFKIAWSYKHDQATTQHIYHLW